MKPQKTADPENNAGKPPANSANSLAAGGNQPDLADRVLHHADAILRASGSGLHNYSMDGTRRAILSASLDFANEMMRRGAEIARQTATDAIKRGEWREG